LIPQSARLAEIAPRCVLYNCPAITIWV
jgi:hypothetical protein